MAAKNVNRRRFLTDMARTACGVSLFGLGLGLYARQGQSLPSEYIRPPGALDEEKFLSACVRCGACVEDCPYHILKLAELGKDNAATGTPYFKARAGACEMCEDIPCIPNCPTGALDHGLTDINKARMGLAVLIDQETCIAFQGLRCEVCYNICPLKGKALTLEYQPNKRTFMHAMFIPTVHSRHCTGCGLCERACILEREAIKVLPVRLAKGELGHHYRFGWKEKEKAGHALVTPDPKHKFRLPKGETYDYEGSGRIHKVNPGSAPGKASGSSGGAASVLNSGIKEAK